MSDDFSSFLDAYPPDPDPKAHVPVSDAFREDVEASLGVEVPTALVEFWERCGCGYFGDRELFFFGDRRSTLPRPSLVDWNRESFWREIYPDANNGGPLFFAETCFGDQLGFRREAGSVIAVLFSIDSFDAYVLCDMSELFDSVLAQPAAIVDPDRLAGVRRLLGPLALGKHYAPIVSPIVGGSEDLHNFRIESAVVHVRTAIATFRSVQGR